MRIAARIAGLAAVGAGLSLLASGPAGAAVTLLAKGQLGGRTDLSGLTAPLESGVPGNILGGTGSGLAWAGGSTFFGLPDRGPNANVYNAAIDNTVSYVARFHTLDLSLSLAAPGAALPFVLTPSLIDTTLLYSASPLAYGSGAGLGVGNGAPGINTAGAHYFTGRSDNYAPGDSLNPANARLDPEGIRMSNDGRTVFVSDEYGPYVRAFDAATGELVRTYALDPELAIDNLSPRASVERSGNSEGRYTNSGMEGLAITPDGTTLVGAIQGALLQDRALGQSNLLRFVTIDIATGATRQYAYMLTTGTGVSEIVAINDHEFLVLERDGTGLGNGDAAAVKQIFKIDTTGAADVTGLDANAAAAAAVAKDAMPSVDIVAALTAAGVDPAQIPSKMEGLAFGKDVSLDGTTYHTLYLSDDNDFLPDTSGDNHFYVFGFTDADLPGFEPQDLASAVPEPSSWAMLLAGFGAIGGTIRRRRVTASLGYA